MDQPSPDLTDLADRIERSFGAGPEPAPPLGELLATGRRAVRRRRVAAVAASVAVVAAIATGSASLAGGGTRADAPVSGLPGGTPSASATLDDPTTASPETERRPSHKELLRVSRRELVTFGEDRKVVIKGGTVLQRIDNPFHLAPPADSVGVELLVDGVRYWYANYLAPDGSQGSAMQLAIDAKTDFAAFVASQAGNVGPHQGDSVVGPDVWPGVVDLDLVSFAGDTEQLAPSAGVTILEQQAHVSVGDSFAGPGDQTAAAEVRDADGKVYYVLARRFDGKQAQYIAVAKADGGVDLAAFLDLARSRYAEGGGGLL